MNVKKNHLRQFWRSSTVEGGVKKLETGVSGFDELLEGGLPEGRTVLISAGPGCGKTVLLADYIYRGVTEFQQPGIFLTFEERPKDVFQNLRSFGWDYEKYIDEGLISIIDASLPDEIEVKYGESINWLEPLLARIEYTANKIGAKRIAIDNLGAALLRYEAHIDSHESREKIFRFMDGIKSIGLTTLLSTERSESSASLRVYGVEEFVSEGVIELNLESHPSSDVRTIRVIKLRGCGFRSGKVIFDINNHGIEIYPKIPIDTSVGTTDFSMRETFGIPGLDDALGGGVPQGHVMLITGNTGTGKSTLGMHFVKAGLENKQPSIWVALEEPVKQVMKTAKSHGWDFQPYLDNNSFRFITAELINIIPDKLIYDIIDTVQQTDAKRIVVDSVSSMESATMNRESVREFMMQLAGFAKTKGITVILNYLSGSSFGAGTGQLLGTITTNDMRLSSIVDGIIMLRYVERDQGVEKLINVLKLRGSDHVKDILRFEINKDGFMLGKRFGVHT